MGFTAATLNKRIKKIKPPERTSQHSYAQRTMKFNPSVLLCTSLVQNDNAVFVLASMSF
jgi:hypothetical protein